MQRRSPTRCRWLSDVLSAFRMVNGTRCLIPQPAAVIVNEVFVSWVCAVCGVTGSIMYYLVIFVCQNRRTLAVLLKPSRRFIDIDLTEFQTAQFSCDNVGVDNLQ